MTIHSNPCYGIFHQLDFQTTIFRVTTEAMHTKGLQRFGTIGHGMKLKILKLIVIDLLTISR